MRTFSVCVEIQYILYEEKEISVPPAQRMVARGGGGRQRYSLRPVSGEMPCHELLARVPVTFIKPLSELNSKYEPYL